MRQGMRIAWQSATFALALVAISGPATAMADDASTTAKHASCTSHGTRAALVSFVTAFNSGDYKRLDSLFAGEPAFEWYSSESPGRRQGTDAKHRATLIAYFRARRAQGDRFGLSSFGFNGNSPRHGNFEMVLKRRVRGFMHGDWLRQPGKGAVVCDGDTVELIVMSLGRPSSA